jgi:hypothetical protein
MYWVGWVQIQASRVCVNWVVEPNDSYLGFDESGQLGMTLIFFNIKLNK